MNPHDRRAIERILAEEEVGSASLIPTLLAIQEQLGHLPPEALRLVRAHSDVSDARLAELLSFYPRFRTRPAGRHRVQVCTGTACYVQGAADTLAELRHQLGIAEGEDTDPRGMFTVEAVACLGCCMLAPVVRIDERTYGQLSAARVPEVLDDFQATVKRRATGATAKREGRRAESPASAELRLCVCTSCSSAGADALDAELRRLIRTLALPATVRNVGCTGLSTEAPVVDLVHRGRSVRYGRLTPQQAKSMLLAHLSPGSAGARATVLVSGMLERALSGEPATPPSARRLAEGSDPRDLDRPGQLRMSTRHAGQLDPLDLDAYIASGGFQALQRATDRSSASEIIELIARAGLRGRGGAGYDTATKWRNALAAPPGPRVVICNGDEGEPGAFMDRMILESFPFRVLEGMAIAAVTIGADEGHIYVRGEYRQAIERLRRAVALCAERGLIGGHPPDGAPRFEVRIFEGAGAFVCGEETAMLEAMEGRRGTPRIRPPYPTERGLRGLPTLVNNVETFALVPGIIAEGPQGFAALGTAASKGTKTFALAGRIARGGLVEVPMGITLRQVVEEIGGGNPRDRTLTAIQVGGPSGGCVPASMVDTPVDFEALQAAGAIMGSGGMIVLDDGDCVVDLARYYTAFARQESCGRCSACRIGTVRMLEILDDICEGRGREEQLQQLEDLGAHLASASRCGLGRTAPNSALSTLRHFRESYLAHIAGRCPAGRCKGLIRYRISERCIGCTRCAQRCPAQAIEGRPHHAHRIDEDACTRCDICRQACPAEAVEVS